MRAGTLACVAVALACASACDLRAFLLDTDALPGQREAAARGCCRCLAGSLSPDPEARCEELVVDEDAGAAPDAGPNRCLCGVDEQTCSQLLLSGGQIELVGACVDEGSVCAADCSDVLAFP